MPGKKETVGERGTFGNNHFLRAMGQESPGKVRLVGGERDSTFSPRVGSTCSSGEVGESGTRDPPIMPLSWTSSLGPGEAVSSISTTPRWTPGGGGGWHSILGASARSSDFTAMARWPGCQHLRRAAGLVGQPGWGGLPSPAGSSLSARSSRDPLSLDGVRAKHLPAGPAEPWVLRTSRVCWRARAPKGGRIKKPEKPQFLNLQEAEKSPQPTQFRARPP